MEEENKVNSKEEQKIIKWVNDNPPIKIAYYWIKEFIKDDFSTTGIELEENDMTMDKAFSLLVKEYTRKYGNDE
jgi:hypothetical protein